MPAEPPYRIVRHRGSYSLAHGKPRVRIALGTNEPGLAEARAREIWRARTPAASEKVEDLWQAYVADRKIDGVDTKKLDSLWNALKADFGYKIGNIVTKDDCRAYAKKRIKAGKSASTARTELEYLRACLNFKYGKGNSNIWLPAASKPRQRYLQIDEVTQLLDKTETPHIRLFIILALTTGARMGALLELKWDQVDFEHRTVDLDPPGRIKTNKGRTIVPINERALAALTHARTLAQTDHVIEYADTKVASVKRAIASAARRSGVQCSSHVFRHTAGVWMAQADVPLQKISQYLAHSSTRVTERVYARYSPSFMKDAAKALDW